MKMESIYIYNYITTNLINGKQYVGMHTTRNLNDGYLGGGKMLRYSIKKYGKHNFKKEILCFCDDKDKAFNNEKLYIEKYNTLIPNGYNISPHGGTQSPAGWSQEMKNRHSFSHIGKPSNWKGCTPSIESRIKMRLSHLGRPSGRKGIKHKIESIIKMSKPVLQYSLNGVFIKEWPSAKEAYNTLKISHNIATCCKGKRKNAGGFIWKYKNEI